MDENQTQGEVAATEPVAAPVETPQAEQVAQEVPQEVKSPEAQFVDRYKALCEETGFILSVEPVMRKNNDDSYSLAIDTRVVKKA